MSKVQATVYPGALRGSVRVPQSKSHVHRLLIAAALSPGRTVIGCPAQNADIDATIRCLTALNARIIREGDDLAVTGLDRGAVGQATLDCGESGSTLRFLMPLCAALPVRATLTGRGRLPERPNGPLIDALRANGAAITGGALPMTVAGGLMPGRYVLPGNVSSQFFTGLLFALPILGGDSVLQWSTPLESAPYIELTLSVLRQFGIRADSVKDGWAVPGGQAYTSPGRAEAEGDWSAAAFYYAANALGSDVRPTGLLKDTCQGDSAIEALIGLIGGTIDVTDTPDLVPALAAAAAASRGKTTRITGAARLRIKESDRLDAMVRAISALGGSATETADGLLIEGAALTGGVVDGQNDHRIVMAAAVMATAAASPVTILGAEAVNKSYPRFFEDLMLLGGKADV